MPDASALVLLTPPPPVSPQTPTYSSTSDSSFQDSLDLAQQRQASAPTDTTSQPDKSAKKPEKSTKPKSSTTANKTADVTDSTEEPKDPAETSTPDETLDSTTTAVPKTKTPPSKTAALIKDAKAADPAETIPAVQPQPPKAPAATKSTDSVQAKKKVNTDPVARDTDEDDSPNTDSTTIAATAQSAPPTTVKSANFGAAKVEDSTTDSTTKPQIIEHPSAPQTPAADAADIAATPDALPNAASEADAEPHTADPAAPPLAPAFGQQLQQALAPQPAAKAESSAAPAAQPQFTEANHPSIVTGIHTQLMPNGGSMQLHLDPPELGALQITVEMKNGIMSASFQTSNDQASRMLSHSLSQLKSALETTGITVEKIHVQQAPRQQSSSSNSDSQQQHSKDPDQQQQARQDQQRKQMLQKMWSKLAGIEDPLDLVA